MQLPHGVSCPNEAPKVGGLGQGCDTDSGGESGDPGGALQALREGGVSLALREDGGEEWREG